MEVFAIVRCLSCWRVSARAERPWLISDGRSAAWESPDQSVCEASKSNEKIRCREVSVINEGKVKATLRSRKKTRSAKTIDECRETYHPQSSQSSFRDTSLHSDS